MSQTLAAKANYPTISPNTVVAKFVPPGSGNYTSGGETVSLLPANFTDPNQVGLIGPFTQLPVDVEVEIENGNGYQGQWVPGTSLSTGKLQLFLANGTEYSGTWATWIGLGSTVILRINLNPSDQ